jgi:hypothetical protein
MGHQQQGEPTVEEALSSWRDTEHETIQATGLGTMCTEHWIGGPA